MDVKPARVWIEEYPTTPRAAGAPGRGLALGQGIELQLECRVQRPGDDDNCRAGSAIAAAIAAVGREYTSRVGSGRTRGGGKRRRHDDEPHCQQRAPPNRR